MPPDRANLYARLHRLEIQQRLPLPPSAKYSTGERGGSCVSSRGAILVPQFTGRQIGGSIQSCAVRQKWHPPRNPPAWKYKSSAAPRSDMNTLPPNAGRASPGPSRGQQARYNTAPSRPRTQIAASVRQRHDRRSRPLMRVRGNRALTKFPRHSEIICARESGRRLAAGNEAAIWRRGLLGAVICTRSAGRGQETARPASVEAVVSCRRGAADDCISTQAGCAVMPLLPDGAAGLIRNLSAGEIVAQVLLPSKNTRPPYAPQSNIVLDGQGEPPAEFRAGDAAYRFCSIRRAWGFRRST